MVRVPKAAHEILKLLADADRRTLQGELAWLIESEQAKRLSLKADTHGSGVEGPAS